MGALVLAPADEPKGRAQLSGTLTDPVLQGGGGRGLGSPSLAVFQGTALVIHAAALELGQQVKEAFLVRGRDPRDALGRQWGHCGQSPTATPCTRLWLHKTVAACRDHTLLRPWPRSGPTPASCRLSLPPAGYPSPLPAIPPPCRLSLPPAGYPSPLPAIPPPCRLSLPRMCHPPAPADSPRLLPSCGCQPVQASVITCPPSPDILEASLASCAVPAMPSFGPATSSLCPCRT
ncbi:hypothetical protein P7K49_002061 [Saguinus oedipus]|uniref:Uncharacterized protein n=1 Tax=Saguinus oedipus TaxID=9490 RepID=A0ABQ9WGV0_SAGOE|nr:hypothetical protein P7K49_002061 [Saguinus oedipus]